MRCESCKIDDRAEDWIFCNVCKTEYENWDGDPKLKELSVNWRQIGLLKKNNPDYLDKYIEATTGHEKSKERYWTRSSGEEVKISDMSYFHIKGAMGVVLRFIEDTGNIPDIYYHLAEEMKSRGYTVPEPPVRCGE